jgi:hypothetical protein
VLLSVAHDAAGDGRRERRNGAEFRGRGAVEVQRVVGEAREDFGGLIRSLRVRDPFVEHPFDAVEDACRIRPERIGDGLGYAGPGNEEEAEKKEE